MYANIKRRTYPSSDLRRLVGIISTLICIVNTHSCLFAYIRERERARERERKTVQWQRHYCYGRIYWNMLQWRWWAFCLKNSQPCQFIRLPLKHLLRLFFSYWLQTQMLLIFYFLIQYGLLFICMLSLSFFFNSNFSFFFFLFLFL